MTRYVLAFILTIFAGLSLLTMVETVPTETVLGRGCFVPHRPNAERQ